MYALYNDEQQAEQARAKLIAAGIARRAIQTLALSSEERDHVGSFASHRHPDDILRALSQAGLSESDAQACLMQMAQGAMLLLVRPNADQMAQAAEILRASCQNRARAEPRGVGGRGCLLGRRWLGRSWQVLQQFPDERLPRFELGTKGADIGLTNLAPQIREITGENKVELLRFFRRQFESHHQTPPCNGLEQPVDDHWLAPATRPTVMGHVCMR